MLNYNKLNKQIASMGEIAKKNKWVLAYDKELDQFYFSPKEIGNGFTLHALGDEFLVYIDKDSNVGGVLMEYFKHNLIRHDVRFKPLRKLLEKEINKAKPKFNKSEQVLLTETLKSVLGEEMQSSIRFC